MNFEKLTDFTLSHGYQATPKDGFCFMQAVAWLEGEEHTDKPACADRNVGNFMIWLNDASNDEQRQLLIPLLPRVAGTAGMDVPAFFANVLQSALDHDAFVFSVKRHRMVEKFISALREASETGSMAILENYGHYEERVSSHASVLLSEAMIWVDGPMMTKSLKALISILEQHLPENGLTIDQKVMDERIQEYRELTPVF